MARLTVQEPGLTGADVTLAAATAGGDEFINDGHTMLRVYNGGGGSITVTTARNRNCNQGFSHSNAVTVETVSTHFIGPFPRDEFPSIVEITYSGVTSVTVGAFKC